LLGFASGDDTGSFIAFSAEQKAAMGAIVLAPLGLLVGLAIPPSAEWKEVPEARVRVSFAPHHGRAAVALTVRF
jgi:hypothetical protein